MTSSVWNASEHFRCELAAATTTSWRRPGSLRGAKDEPYVTHKNSVGKKKRKDKEIIYVVWYIHYQENTIVLGTTELQCLGETRGRVRSWVWQRPTGEFAWTELGKSMKMRGKLLCSGVGIKNSYKHLVLSADIDIIFGRMLKNWAVYNVNRGNAQAMAQ